LEVDLSLIYAPGNPDMFYQVCIAMMLISSQNCNVGCESPRGIV
jgi:hypothetical protein